MKSAIIYCQIHILRGIRWVIGAGNMGQDSIGQHMASIMEATSREQYYEILDAIQGKPWL
jgi:hypothetical protein